MVSLSSRFSKKKTLTVEDITNELKKRQGISGIEEKLNRTKKVK